MPKEVQEVKKASTSTSQEHTLDVIREQTRQAEMGETAVSKRKGESLHAPEQKRSKGEKEDFNILSFLALDRNSQAHYLAPERFAGFSELHRATIIDYTRSTDHIQLFTPQRWATLSHKEGEAAIYRTESTDLAKLREPNMWTHLSESHKLQVLARSSSTDLASFRTPERWPTLSEQEREHVIEFTKGSDYHSFRDPQMEKLLSEEHRQLIQLYEPS